MHRPQIVALTLVLLVGATGPRAALALGDTSATASDCSIAAGRDATNNTIVCNFGLSPEQVKELTQAAAAGATGPLTATIVDLSKTLGVTEDATKTLLRIVGQQDVPLERLSETLTRVANDYKRLQVQVAALNPDNATAHDLVEQARAKIDAGNFPEAHRLLAEARKAQIAAAEQARQLREQAQAAEEAQLMGAAASAATEGDLATTEGHYVQAADLFKQAVDLVPSGHLVERAKYLKGQAGALYRQGDEKGDNAALEPAIQILHGLLPEITRERYPLDWAATQNQLGLALQTLGERKSGTDRLEEAVAAYRAALEEWTRERVPLDWAEAQNNLGTALQALGERESGTARLEEAVAAFRAALEEWTRERVPLQWANAQNNLGIALQTLGERTSNPILLNEALAAVRNAYEVVIKEAGYLQYETYFIERLELIQADLNQIAEH